MMSYFAVYEVVTYLFIAFTLCLVLTKTGTRCITCQDELSFIMHLERCTTKDSSSICIIQLVSVFILEMHNQTNYKCLPKLVQTDNLS